MISLPIIMSSFLLLLAAIGFAACLAARLGRTWHYWLCAGCACFGWYLYAVNLGGIPGSQAFGNIGAGAIFGLLGPEIGEMIRGLARRPKTWGYVVLVVGGLVALANPQILGPILAIGIIVAGMRFVLARAFGGKKRR